MATIPIFNPKVPFLGLISDGFQVGKMIRFKAVIGSYTDRLQIYFQTGPALNPRSDVPLLLSLRPAEGAIVRNSMRYQAYEHEERFGGFPIQVGSQFEVLILVESACFKIAINGSHFCTFNHRMPFYQINYISVDGGPAISVISITSEYDRPGQCVPPPPPVIGYPQPSAPSIYPNHHDLPPPYTPNVAYPSVNVTYIPAPPPPPPPKKSGSGLRIATAVTGGLIAGSLLSNRHHHGRHHHHHC